MLRVALAAEEVGNHWAATHNAAMGSRWLGVLLCGVTACGPGGAGSDAGTSSLERCSTSPLDAQPPRHFELVPSGVRPGSALRAANGETRLVEGGPVLRFTDAFTRASASQPFTPAPLSPITPTSTTDDLAVLLDPRVVNDFETTFAFAKSATGQTIADYRAAIRIDPTSQLAVRVGMSGVDYLVNGQGQATELRPWTAGDTLISGATRFLIADVVVVFDFGGDGACHLRNLARILKPEGALAFSQFFATTSAAQLSELQRYLAAAAPRTRVFTLRSNGPAFGALPQCDLTSLESCLGLVDALTATETAWLRNCPAPTNQSLLGAPESCLVEGQLTLRSWP